LDLCRGQSTVTLWYLVKWITKLLMFYFKFYPTMASCSFLCICWYRETLYVSCTAVIAVLSASILSNGQWSAMYMSRVNLAIPW
jgi:hypothetical protein